MAAYCDTPLEPVFTAALMSTPSTGLVNPSRRAFLRGRRVEATALTGEPRHAVIGGACVAHRNVVCRSCGDLCADQAIRFQPRLNGAAVPEVDSSRCNACGDCLGACPTAAIVLAPVQGPATLMQGSS